MDVIMYNMVDVSCKHIITLRVDLEVSRFIFHPVHLICYKKTV